MIPFLVLAVGVDNIFILVQTHQRLILRDGESSAECIGRALGKVGPSILLTSSSEAACFLIGKKSYAKFGSTISKSQNKDCFGDFYLLEKLN